MAWPWRPWGDSPWCDLGDALVGVCGEDGGGSSTCAARETNCRVVKSGGQLPRPSAGLARGGTGDEGTRDTASMRSRVSGSAVRIGPGGLWDATHVTRLRLGFARTSRERSFAETTTMRQRRGIASLCGDASACVRRGLGSGRAVVCVREWRPRRDRRAVRPCGVTRTRTPKPVTVNVALFAPRHLVCPVGARRPY